MSTCCCCCCCWAAVGVPDDSPRITGGPGCSGPPPLCIFQPGARGGLRRPESLIVAANLTRQSTSCCSSIIVRPLPNAAAASFLELSALQISAGEMATHHRSKSRNKNDPVRFRQPKKKKFLLPLPTSTNEQTRSKNIGYLNVKNVSLSPASLSRPPDRRGFRGEHFFLRGTTFRLLAGISAHSRRTAHTFPGPIAGQIFAKNSENRTFLKTFGALLQAAAADDTRL